MTVDYKETRSQQESEKRFPPEVTSDRASSQKLRSGERKSKGPEMGKGQAFGRKENNEAAAARV